MPASMWRAPVSSPRTCALRSPRSRAKEWSWGWPVASILRHRHWVVSTRQGAAGRPAAPDVRLALAALADKRVVVGLAVRLYPAPPELGDIDPAGRDGRAGFKEVVHEREPEVLDAPGQVALRQRVDRVAHGVGSQKLGVVPVVVGVVEVALQGDADVQIPDLVDGGVALHLEEADLGLAVVVLAEDDLPQRRLAHRPPSVRGFSTRSSSLRRPILEISASAAAISAPPPSGCPGGRDMVWDPQAAYPADVGHRGLYLLLARVRRPPLGSGEDRLL